MKTLLYKLDHLRCLPTKRDESNIGWDLKAYAEEPLILSPSKTLLVRTGVRIALPAGYWACVRSHTELSLQGILLMDFPIVSHNCRKEIGVTLHNLSNVTRTIAPFSRIAQLIIFPQDLPWRATPEMQRELFNS